MITKSPARARCNTGRGRAGLVRPAVIPTWDRQACASHPGLCAYDLLQIDWLIAPGLVELRTPYFVRRLVLGTAEGQRGPEPGVEIPDCLQRIHQLFRIKLRAGTSHAFRQQVAGHIALERNVVRALAGEILGERSFVIEDQ